MNGLACTVSTHFRFTRLVECSASSPPSVVFIHQPKDRIIPWQGRVELQCRVNHSHSTYTWLTTRFAPVDLHYYHGTLQPLRRGNELLQPEVEVVESQWCRPYSDGRLVIIYPGAPDQLPPSGPTLSSRNVRGQWLEGVYRCKATVSGHGSLLSRPALVRLTDIFLEPGISAVTRFVQPEPSFSDPGGTPPSLGGGYFWPGEVAVLRCPIKYISEQQPIIRWFFQSKDGTLMQPVGEQSTELQWPGEFQTIPLENGQWLEVHLGKLQENRTRVDSFTKLQQNDASENHVRLNEPPRQHTWPAQAGFGEYFCKVHIPRNWATAGQSEVGSLNISGPYIRVDLAPAFTGSLPDHEKVAGKSRLNLCYVR
ncbi:hypothetical protein PHET_01993 [Paragonimus heterotremus]|uniref:Uncharacterized protein n=1 Tax=Paragonimus heterotremus TaxID=100268 RepID=A0A8J4WIZ0_9TREM|nr:hypothetical protein PHET_01993 [Paragonimus heterotremus]